MNAKHVGLGQNDTSARFIVITGFIALAIAMGIGRFAFTPLMPLMLRDGTISAATGSEWAVANYGGYLFGALTASWFAADPRRGLWLGLIGIVLTTLAIAFVSAPPSLDGAALRAVAGVLSAWVLVCASGWCLAELAGRQAATLGGWIYVGVGFGIACTGILTWLGGQQSAQLLWIELGLVATFGTLFVMRCMQRIPVQPSPAKQVVDGVSVPRTSSAGRGNSALVLCYAAFGFGYIVPATFLPTMARQQVHDPLVFGLTWPIFGIAAALSVTVVTRWMSARPRRQVWAMAQGAMALGTLLPLFSQAMWALAASAVLVGGTFMVATMAGLQLAREQCPENPTPLLARMTAGFAVGQIAGPLLVRVIGPGQVAGWDALTCANVIATALLAVSALWLWSHEGI